MTRAGGEGLQQGEAAVPGRERRRDNPQHRRRRRRDGQELCTTNPGHRGAQTSSSRTDLEIPNIQDYFWVSLRDN